MRYRLRTLLILTGIACVVLATHGKWVRDAQRRSALRNKIQEMAKGAVVVQHEDFDSKKANRGKYPGWLERAVGAEYLYPINAFCLVQSAEPDPIIREAAQLPHLYLVKIPACQITDDSKLKTLNLIETKVSREGLVELRKALPETNVSPYLSRAQKARNPSPTTTRSTSSAVCRSAKARSLAAISAVHTRTRTPAASTPATRTEQ
jgi:hypothetical protein